MPATILMLLTCKIGFAATDAVTGLKLVEKGVPKVKANEKGVSKIKAGEEWSALGKS